MCRECAIGKDEKRIASVTMVSFINCKAVGSVTGFECMYHPDNEREKCLPVYVGNKRNIWNDFRVKFEIRNVAACNQQGKHQA